jgi:glycosyltransferase involved in cell wall biosynthesis
MNELTVIIPTYNRSDLLLKAIESCVAQDDSRFDLIIIDNHSDDNTAELLKSFKLNHDWAKIIENDENVGAGKSIQRALDSVNTEWATILCDDDFLDHSFVRKFLSKMETTSKSIILCGYREINDREDALCEYAYSQVTLDLQKAVEEIFIKTRIRIPGVSGFAFKMRKNLEFKQYPKGFLSDTMLIAESILEGDGIEVLPEVLYNRMAWQGSESSFSIENLKLYNKALLQFNDDMRKIIAQGTLNDTAVKILSDRQPLWQFFTITCKPLLAHGEVRVRDIYDFASIFIARKSYVINMLAAVLTLLICLILPLCVRRTALNGIKSFVKFAKREFYA